VHVVSVNRGEGRRRGGGPGWERARKPVGTHPNLLVVGVGNPIAVPGLARFGARRGEIRRLRSADLELSGSLSTKAF
jgi:hypothetical protein